MTVINNPLWQFNYGNTGQVLGGCKLNIDNIKMFILVPSNLSFVIQDKTAKQILEAIQEKTKSTTQKERCFVVKGITKINNKSKEPTVLSLGTGEEKEIRDGSYSFEFETLNGIYFNKQIRKFNNREDLSVIFVDVNNVLWGRNYADTLKGFEISDIFTKAVDITAETANLSKTVTKIALKDIKQINDEYLYIKYEDNLDLYLQGLINVELVKINTGTGTVTVKVQDDENKINLYDDYSSVFGVAGAYLLSQNGAAVTITSVTANDLTKTFTIAFSGTGNFDLTFANDILINGFEGVNTINFTIS